MTGVPYRPRAEAYPSLQDGQALYDLARELYPICRSITGEGVRQTLRRLSDFVPLEVREVPSGTQVLDWVVPEEWNITEAWIADLHEKRIIDFRNSNLHVVNYSRPIRARVTRNELDKHLHSLPDHPDWIPYRTSYYADTWGFCLTERQRTELRDAEYDVCINSTLARGSLSYGEVVLRGELEDEVLLSAHVCHPSLANDNLSGIVTLLAVIQELQLAKRRYTYRVLFAPGTIGALAWLALNEAQAFNVRHGLVVTCLGDSGDFTYKQSRRECAVIDRAVEYVLGRDCQRYSVRRFSPDGYDERQYCSPGFNLPVGRLTRTPNGEYPEYHTSADNLTLIRPEQLLESVRLVRAVTSVVEGNARFVSTSQKGEPQLGRRGLYHRIGGSKGTGAIQSAILWLLNYSDGHHDVLDIATRSGLPFDDLVDAGRLLVECGLLISSPEPQQLKT